MKPKKRFAFWFANVFFLRLSVEYGMLVFAGTLVHSMFPTIMVMFTALILFQLVFLQLLLLWTWFSLLELFFQFELR
jgi:hypothetical protein